MKKVSLWRVLLVIIMLVFASIWVYKYQPSAPEEKPAEKPVELPPPTEEKPAPPAVKWKASKNFTKLPGWENADLKKSLETFKVSCRVFLRQPTSKDVGTDVIPLTAGDWHPVCKAALKLADDTPNKEIKAFFEAWFKPGRFYQDGKRAKGLFTGYFVPTFDGSPVKAEGYDVPVYGMPKNLVAIRLNDFDPNLPNRKLIGRVDGHQIYPFHTREDINNGAVASDAPVMVWLKSQLDRLFLEIQGSGVIKLNNGKSLFLGYVAQNGAPYTSIASVLIKRGVMTWDNASMQNIKKYFAAHPDEISEVLNQNKSFVFFEKQNKGTARGAQGVYLTGGYSLAVDRAFVPLGMPLWLDTTYPNPTMETPAMLERLFIAQDTGGAIKGAVRGDVFWGEGEKAGEIAGRMKNPGVYWLLVPRDKPVQ